MIRSVEYLPGLPVAGWMDVTTAPVLNMLTVS